MGVTGKRVEKFGMGGRARTMAETGPTNLLYGSRGLPAAYRHPGSFSPDEPCPSGPRVTIDDIIRESSVEAPEERGYSERRMGTDMQDIVSFCEGKCRKQCHLQAPAGESGEVTSCNNGSKSRRYRKRGSQKPFKGDAETAMEMMPSPVRRMFSAASDSEGHQTCYHSDSTGIEADFPVGRSQTAPSPELPHDTERESLLQRAATTRVPRHTGDGEEVGRMDADGTRDTGLSRGEERGAPGKLPGDREGDDRHCDQDNKKAACVKAVSGDRCQCHPQRKLSLGGQRCHYSEDRQVG